MVAYHNRLYAIGGYDGKKKKKSVEVYDPEENRYVMNYSGDPTSKMVELNKKYTTQSKTGMRSSLV